MNFTKLCLTLILLISLPAMANNECFECDTKLDGIPDIPSELTEVHAAVDPTIQDLANQICNNMVLLNETGVRSPWEALESGILGRLDIEPDAPNRRAIVTDFWNKHQQQMICTDELLGFNSPQHVMKRAIEMNVISSFYFEYLLRDRNTEVNAIEYVNGQPETVLDFIDSIINDPKVHPLYDLNQIKQLKAFLSTIMGAKSAKELLNT